MTHKNKIKLARKMMSRDEIERHVPIFDSKNWQDRAEARKNKEWAKIKKPVTPPPQLKRTGFGD